MDLYSRMLANPTVFTAFSANLMVDYMHLWHSSWMKMMGMQAAARGGPAKGDGRFKDDDWTSNFLFDYIKQSYLIASRQIQHAVASVEGMPAESEKKSRSSPASTWMRFRPRIRAHQSRGAARDAHERRPEPAQGLNNLLSDIEKGNGSLHISMTDEKAFQLGKNVATTPGKVVYQTELMQLIQFLPTTKQVCRTPLVIIPPWINKYYILDLRESNSFIKWALDQGHTVFVLSWVNPDARLAQMGFDDYMKQGPLAALDAVEKATGERQVNFIGYCLGGTLLGAPWLPFAPETDRPGAQCHLLREPAGLLGPGELGVFIDEAQVENLEKKMNERGYLEGSEMASTFNLLRANDLVWSFVINNYLMGKDPFPFDLLYWNSDSTRMPARMHSFYLRNMYLKNLLGVPGGISLDGVPIDLSKVKVPAYFVSTVEDHIAPWKTVYKGANYLGGDVRFVLGGSAISRASSTRRRRRNTTTGPTTPSPLRRMSGSRPRPSARARGGRTGRRGWTRKTPAKKSRRAFPATANSSRSRTGRQLRHAAPGGEAITLS